MSPRSAALPVVLVAACGGATYDPQRFADVCGKTKGYEVLAAPVNDLF